MKKINYLFGTSLLALALPVLVFAQDFNSILSRVQGIINSLIPFIIGLAVLVFLWGVFSYITAGADEEKRGKARDLIIWGVVFLFVMVSVWGLVNILINTFGLDDSIPQTPKLPF